MSILAVDVPALLAQHVLVEEENRFQPLPQVKGRVVSNCARLPNTALSPLSQGYGLNGSNTAPVEQPFLSPPPLKQWAEAVLLSTVRVQRGPSEAASCASKESKPPQPITALP